MAYRALARAGHAHVRQPQGTAHGRACSAHTRHCPPHSSPLSLISCSTRMFSSRLSQQSRVSRSSKTGCLTNQAASASASALGGWTAALPFAPWQPQPTLLLPPPPWRVCCPHAAACTSVRDAPGLQCMLSGVSCHQPHSCTPALSCVHLMPDPSWARVLTCPN